MDALTELLASCCQQHSATLLEVKAPGPPKDAEKLQILTQLRAEPLPPEVADF